MKFLGNLDEMVIRLSYINIFGVDYNSNYLSLMNLAEKIITMSIERYTINSIDNHIDCYLNCKDPEHKLVKDFILFVLKHHYEVNKNDIHIQIYEIMKNSDEHNLTDYFYSTSKKIHNIIDLLYSVSGLTIPECKKIIKYIEETGAKKEYRERKLSRILK